MALSIKLGKSPLIEWNWPGLGAFIGRMGGLISSRAEAYEGTGDGGYWTKAVDSGELTGSDAGDSNGVIEIESFSTVISDMLFVMVAVTELGFVAPTAKNSINVEVLNRT
ncbi:Hypothetical predicted protein [Olea europaea subsp. europaea]|uniref:Uncharacterized protein n=1 Tax=Olea europaea subsp. europaea TaxID=158383 RepID=A0A8S0TX81_OLEEU|nr:Hypothetical predicted protein [Olea europaea subsp. europaea]